MERSTFTVDRRRLALPVPLVAVSAARLRRREPPKPSGGMQVFPDFRRVPGKGERCRGRREFWMGAGLRSAYYITFTIGR